MAKGKKRRKNARAKKIAKTQKESYENIGDAAGSRDKAKTTSSDLPIQKIKKDLKKTGVYAILSVLLLVVLNYFDISHTHLSDIISKIK